MAAQDNFGLTIRITSYNVCYTKLLRVPGAKVYVGGNHGYAGRFVGEAPLELRDFPAGPASVVVERAGFETFVAQVRPGDRENVNVYAEMVTAIAPSDP